MERDDGLARRCRTPGARYRIQLNPDAIAIRVGAIDDLDAIALTEREAIKVEQELHDAVEKIIAPFWKRTREGGADGAA